MPRRHLAALTGLLALGLATTLAAEDRVGPADPPRVQIAILLDTSGSMQGLIEQAKTHLWKIVNTFATARRDGVAPAFEVALYEYGNDGLDGREGYIRQIVPLTTDLDKVSEELFKLTTNGGSEFCGHVIQTATRELSWSPAGGDYKAIFIAGNEPFTQGTVHYADACKAAITRGIIINTIHCGGYDQGVEGKWLDGAQLADGSYSHIDQNQTVVHIPAPQDDELATLNAQFNKTYVAYGQEAEEAQARQVAQDAAASKLSGGVLMQRIQAKGGANYRNAQWDLVDASKEEGFDITTVKDADLPEELRGKSADEKKAYVEAKATERAELQAKIKDLSQAREAYVAAERKKLAEAAGDQAEASLDDAILGAVRKQLTDKAYTFEKQ